MKIEHLGITVEDPVAVAKWYVENLGFKILRSTGAPTYTHFLCDGSGKVMIEIYNNPEVEVPDYWSVDPLHLHLAFTDEQVDEKKKKLIAAGAKPEGETYVTDAGDIIAMLRDPWGLPVQLVKRGTPMV